MKALASCDVFVEWLGSAASSSTTSTVSLALLKTLLSLNNSDMYGDSGGVWDGGAISPDALLGSLRSHGWHVDADEQDAHEMLHVLLTSLEEEAQKRAEEEAETSNTSAFFYNDLLSEDDEDMREEEETKSAAASLGDDLRARRHISPSPPPSITTPGG